jgi:hypothetical protein
MRSRLQAREGKVQLCREPVTDLSDAHIAAGRRIRVAVGA